MVYQKGGADNRGLDERQGVILHFLLHNDLLANVQHLQFFLEDQQERVDGQLRTIRPWQVIDVPHEVVKDHDAALLKRHPCPAGVLHHSSR